MNSSTLPIELHSVGFGAYQIGVEVAKKYASYGTPMPNEKEAEALLHGVLNLGITLVDTAPAYGCSEERVGKYLQHRREEYNLCTKVGELTIDGQSTFDFSAKGMRRSIEHSLRLLKTDCVDALLIHAPPADLSVLHQSDAVEMMHAFKEEGKTKTIGFSGKTVEAQEEALTWADVMMVEYSFANENNEPIIKQADEKGIVVLIKKAFNSGHLQGTNAIDFLMNKSPICKALHCTVIGSSSLDRMKKNVETFKGLG